MKITVTRTFAAPRERVFAALSDPTVLQQSIPGCERLTRRGNDVYEAQLRIGVAALKGTYAGTIRLQDVRQPESYTLMVDGKGAPGFVRASAYLQLREVAGGTELVCDGTLQVGGTIARVGSRLVEAAAKKLIDDFFHTFGERLEARRD